MSLAENIEHEEKEIAKKAVLLHASQIRSERLPWQSRQLAEPVTDDEKVAQEEFERSIRVQGIIEPLIVERIGSDYFLIAGSRRLAAARKVAPERLILCAIRERSEGASQADLDEARRADNIAENHHRKDLRSWELAEALADFSTAHPTLTMGEIGRRVGLSDIRVGELVRFRRRSCNELWELYRRYGDGGRVTVRQLMALTVEYPKERQVAAYNRLLEEMKGLGGKARRRGKEKAPGPTKLRKRLDAVSLVPEHKEFKRGLSYGLRFALGLVNWRYSDADDAAKKLGAEELLRRKAQLEEEDPSPEP